MSGTSHRPGCSICQRPATLHGSHLGAPAGSYLAESGCHSGVWMDDDEYAEGWDPNVVTRPCPYNPAACDACGGTGNTATDPQELIECEPCGGTGWKGGDWQEPDDRYSAPAPQTPASVEFAGNGTANRTGADDTPGIPPSTPSVDPGA